MAAYALVTFGWRIWLQTRWTGDAGLRATPRTRAEWLAGAGLVLGAIAVYSAPVLDLTGLAELSISKSADRVAGVAVLRAGFLAHRSAPQLDMGESWRIGVDAGEVTALVTGGVFRFVRNRSSPG